MSWFFPASSHVRSRPGEYVRHDSPDCAVTDEQFERCAGLKIRRLGQRPAVGAARHDEAASHCGQRAQRVDATHQSLELRPTALCCSDRAAARNIRRASDASPGGRQPAAHRTDERHSECGRTLRLVDECGDCSFGRGRRRRGAIVGHQIAQCNINLMADGGDSWNTAPGNGASDALVVESAEIFLGPAPSPDNHDVGTAPPSKPIEGSTEIVGRAVTLHARGDHYNPQRRGSPPRHGYDVV
jgi:hypothetical protein